MIHLYYKLSSSTQIDELLNAFTPHKSIDFKEIKSLEYSEIYLVEIGNIDKEQILHIRKLLIDKKQSLIYFFINESNSLILFQLAVLLNVKSIVTKKHETAKVISDIKKELLYQKSTQLEREMVTTISSDKSFLIYDNNELKFASQKIYDDFECKDLEMVKSKVSTYFKLNDFLKNDSNTQKTLNINNKSYNIKASTSPINGEKYIYIEDSIESKDNTYKTGFIKNRIYFIEVLKEKIIEKSISDSSLGIVTIHIENIVNMSVDWSEYEIEMAIRDLILQIDVEIDSHTLIAQYDDGLYLILFEGFDFEEIKLKALSIQSHISKYTKEKKIKPIIGLYAFDINDLELNNILKIIYDISKEEIDHKNIEPEKLHRIIDIDEGLDDNRAIDIFLQATFVNKTPVKLVNIYKGLCISTSSVIVRKTDQEAYMSYESLQGTVMDFEKETIIQSSNISKDIIANVNYLDTKKKVVQLKNFRFVKGSANAREYSRVTCSQRTPVSIVYNKGTISGEILDISINSIAIKTRLHENMDSMELDEVTLNFTLAFNSDEIRYTQLSLKAKVIFKICQDEYCKVVTNLYEDQAGEAVLMEYVYSRQKEIIIELKKQTQLLK
ncbi:PilZ domain-containing protein [Sulfurimonas sp.]